MKITLEVRYLYTMKFIDLIKEDEETRQYKKAQTVYKALRKGSATVSVNVAYIEKNGVESHTFEYILPKENYKINVVNLLFLFI